MKTYYNLMGSSYTIPNTMEEIIKCIMDDKKEKIENITKATYEVLDGYSEENYLNLLILYLINKPDRHCNPYQSLLIYPFLKNPPSKILLYHDYDYKFGDAECDKDNLEDTINYIIKDRLEDLIYDDIINKEADLYNDDKSLIYDYPVNKEFDDNRAILALKFLYNMDKSSLFNTHVIDPISFPFDFIREDLIHVLRGWNYKVDGFKYEIDVVYE